MAGVNDRQTQPLQEKHKSSKGDDKKTKKKSNVVGDTESLMERVRAVEAKLTRLTRNVSEMETLQNNIISSPFCDKEEVYKYEQIVNHIQQVFGEVRGKLRELENVYVKDVTGESALARMKRQQLNRLTNSLASLTNQFFKAQADYMDKIKSRMRTQLEVTKGTSKLSEEEINEFLQKENYSAFTQDFISEVDDAEVQLREIEDRQKDILALEKSVFEVNQLFKDMGVIVHDQSETIDSIEANVTRTATHVDAGKVQLKKAKRLQTKGRKFKFCIAGVILVVAIVLLLIILGAVGVI